MADYTCKRGWILSPDPETGNNVPFFVYVRDKDIIWTTENSIENGVLDVIKNGSIVQKYLAPSIQTILSKSGWEITSFGDDRYEATLRINVGETEFKFYNNLSYDIFTELDLPFETVNDGRFNVSCVTKSKSLDLNTASFNVEFNDTSSITKMKLHLLNPIYNFETEMNKNTEYNTSEIFVRISGRLNLS